MLNGSKISKVLLAIAVVAGFYMMTITEVDAAPISRYGPSDWTSSDGYDGSNPRYVLEATPENVISSITVPVYSQTKPSGNTTVRAGNFRWPVSNGMSISQPRVYFNNRPSGGAGSGYDIVLNPSQFHFDSGSGWYKAEITARLVNANVGSGPYAWRKTATFRLRAPVGMLIGAGENSRYSTLAEAYFVESGNTPAYDYSIPFATPCNVTNNTRRTIYLNDLDSGGADNRARSVTVRVRDVTSGSWVPITTSGSNGDKGTYRITMTYQPSHRYRLMISNMHANNSIDYIFPYDNITYRIDCAWSLSESAAYIRKDGSSANLGTTVTNARPGERYSFFSNWKNNGPTPTNKSITVSRAWDYTYNVGGTPNWRHIAPGVANNRELFSSDIRAGHPRTITQADVGTSFCIHTTVEPRSSSNSRSLNGTEMCVEIPYQYSLSPSVSLASDVIEPGGTAQATPRVNNSGPTKSKDTDWQLSRLVINPGGTIPGGGRSVAGSQPCNFYNSADVQDCQNVSNGNDVVFNPGARSLSTYEDNDLEDLRAGTRVCYGLSVSPRSSGSNQWQHSALECLTIGKRPKVQVRGGSVMAGRVFQGAGAYNSSASVMTSISPYDGLYYGSWSEYAILAPGQIDSMASGAGLFNGNSNGAQNAWSDLTFTRINSSQFGGYQFARQNLPNINSAFRVTSATPDFSGRHNLNALLDGRNGRLVTVADGGTLRINGGELDPGQWIVVNAPSANVIIENDLEYSNDSLSDVDDIPQLIIIARNITINHNVDRVDAWLVANNAVSTCDQGGSIASLQHAYSSQRLTINQCDRQLVVNGPVITSSLYLRRTFGSNPPSQIDEPAEIFNLRPDAYLWARDHTGVSGVYQTTDITELPPRY